MPDRPRSLMDRWNDYQLTKIQAFWFAAACVAATLILGFAASGWITSATAQERIAEAAANARHELATAVCVKRFMQASDAGSRLEKLKQMVWYERDELVSAGGWATMPDRKEPSIVLAELCASELAEIEMPVDPKKVSLGASQ